MMKKLFPVLLAGALASQANGQEQQESPDAKIWVAGNVEWSTLLKDNVSSIGLRIGYMPISLLSVGAWASTMMTDASYVYKGNVRNVDSKMAGLFVEPQLFSKSRIHLTFPLKCGFGGLSYAQSGMEDSKSLGWFAIADLGAFVEMPTSEHFRPSIGAGYRLTNGVDRANLGDHDLRTIYAGMTIKWGNYKD